MEQPWVGLVAIVATELQSPLIYYGILLIAAPGDYNTVTITLTFDPDTSRNCVNFTGFEDGISEPDENFTVSLTGGNDVVFNPDMAVITITGTK